MTKITKALSELDDKLCREAIEDFETGNLKNSFGDAPVQSAEKIYVGGSKKAPRIILTAAACAAVLAAVVAVPAVLDSRKHGTEITGAGSSVDYSGTDNSGADEASNNADNSALEIINPEDTITLVDEAYLAPFRDSFDYFREGMKSEGVELPAPMLKNLGYYVQPLDLSKTVDGMTVTLHALMGCEHNICISYSVTSDLPKLQGETLRALFGFKLLDANGRVLNSGHSASGSGRLFLGCEVIDCTYIDTGMEKISISLTPVCWDEDGSDLCHTPPIDFEFPVSFPETPEITVQQVISDKEVTFTVTPFGGRIVMPDEATMNQYVVSRIFMKDGSVFTKMGGGGTNNVKHIMDFGFEYPIDPYNIDYVGFEYPIDPYNIDYVELIGVENGETFRIDF